MSKSIKPVKDLMNGQYYMFIPHKTYKQGYVAVKFVILHCEVCGDEQVYYWNHMKQREHIPCTAKKGKKCRLIYEQNKRIHTPTMYKGRLITFDNVPQRYRDRSFEPIKAYIKERKQALTPESKKKRTLANKNLKALNEWNKFEAKSTEDTLQAIAKIEKNGDIFYCYTITNRYNDKVYIGITKNYKLRKRQHISTSTRKKNPQYYSRLYCSMRKYGFDAFKWEIVKSSTDYKGICKYEIELIDKLDSMNEDYGYNMSKGGSGAYGAVRSPETRAKLSAITKKQMTPEARAKLSRIAKKNWKDPNYIKRFKEGARRAQMYINLNKTERNKSK
jgi:group I intron endonuclease